MSYSLSIRPAGHGMLMLAAGDSLDLEVDSLECHGDDCLATAVPAAGFTWSLFPPEMGAIDSTGRLRVRRAGRILVRAQREGRAAAESVRVYPAVGQIAWLPHPRQARPGDTLRLSVVALDSAGAEVARIPAHAIVGGTGAAGQVISWGGPEPTIIWLDRSGVLTLIARLAHRWDTLRLDVR